MQSRFYFYYSYLNRFRTVHSISLVFPRLQESVKLKKHPEHPSRMTSFIDRSCKCIADIKKTAEDLKMKLLRRGVAIELFSCELNSIIDKSQMLIFDAENEIQKSCEDTKKQITPSSRNESHNMLPDSMSIKELENDREKSDLDTNGDKKSVKRSSSCLSEPVSTSSGNKSQRRMNYEEDDKGWVTVYIDGSCLNNGTGSARAGLGVWFSANSSLNVSEPVEGRLTNNVGEIEAAIRAIEQADSVGIKKLIVKTDSMFLINCISKWRFTWEKNGWKTSANKPVINRLEIQKLVKLTEKTDIAIRWEYVKAHSNIIGNEAADHLAKQGAEKCKLREFMK